jgi:hypothetical protein
VYSGGRSADEVILHQLAQRARQWVVVTDDRDLGRRARQLGAEVTSLGQWQAKLARRTPAAREERALSPSEVAEWEEYFEGRGEE